MLLQWPLRVLSNPISFRIRLLQPMHPTWWSSCSTTLVLGNWVVLVHSSTRHTLTRWPNAAFDSIAFTSPQFVLRRVPHFSLDAIIMRSVSVPPKRHHLHFPDTADVFRKLQQRSPASCATTVTTPCALASGTSHHKPTIQLRDLSNVGHLAWASSVTTDFLVPRPITGHLS